MATDVASRGLDLPALACVVSYDAPTSAGTASTASAARAAAAAPAPR